jgi:asparagine synthase (glutamine-hydrolysing)
MSSSDGRLWITYNGEIFNFREIRAELEAHGYQFRSRTDAEVILYAYKEWGRDCLARFNGMFAFALWDSRDEVLWLVRDRLGVKPLFYSDQPDLFAFASEIKGILPALPISPGLNAEGLHHFLSLSYMPAPLTLFQGISQLPPAHYLLCPRKDPVQLTRYWDIERAFDGGEQADARLERLLSDAVRLRLVSDVEVGAFLSGGVDSSAIVAWMQGHAVTPVKTFTATFLETPYNEARQARSAAETLGTKHYEQVVQSGDINLLPEIVWHSEELTADSSMLALYRLAQRAREEVKVVLTGDGADEVFGGYSTYMATWLSGIYCRVPGVLRKNLISPIVGLLPVSDKKASLESRIRRFVNGDVEDTARAHASWRVIFTEEEKRALLKKKGSWPPTASLYDPLLEHTHDSDLINQLLYADLAFYLPNDILVKVDRMTMAWGLEARTPYLDYRLVEFAATLPSRVKCGWGLRPKSILRRATRGILPDAIRLRTKAGFNIPKGQWFRREQRTFVENHLLDAGPTILAVFEQTEIERIVREHMNGTADHSHKIWGLLCLSLWWQRFMDGHA